ncbi:cell wall hydrolase [Sphingomonas sp. RP10(2022)]|uniref:Cell wall hydrolase n=2 Tax=Sphingomonas liriopis TaxID=2949094 RepID=A0A9X2HQL8_9SPHN|nr:cell wall hydrolase [Sphingomonas liriopis]MCP3735353.1 cell wall hydrolase [Sphingomonas liriopis]
MSRPLSAVLAATALAAVAVPALVVTHPPAIPKPHKRVALPRRVVPAAELPSVEPVAYVDLSPEDAKAFNAEVPFSTLPNPPARPFRFAGSDEERARATDCMAAGVLYEAGDDTEGERAVAQVVLNRLRHPAFPKTVCGVIFEGEERSTGCQFSFSCDHALTRWTPTGDAWRRAREVAAAALSGAVYRPVGYATHYHTDWVVPYWQASLDKVVAVHSHLFFRWTGWWGTPPAFNRQVSSAEPVIAQLAPISDAHKTAAALAEAETALLEASEALGMVVASDAASETAPLAPASGDTDSFLVTLPSGVQPDLYPTLAAKACGERKTCRFAAWTDAGKTPASAPLTADQVATMAFSYLRDRDTGLERTLWNCAQFPRADRRQCMKRQVLLTALPAPVATSTPVVAKGPDDLGGVRRKAEPALATTPGIPGK